MPEEHDSWFKAAFGVDLAEAVGKIKDDVAATVDKVKGAVAQGAAAATAAAAEVGSFPLGGSVGRKGKNAAGDVRAVQRALGIAADGDCGPQTVDAIKAFQRKMGAAKPDGRVDPGGATERALAAGAQAPVATSSDAGGGGSGVKLDDTASSGWHVPGGGAAAVEGDLVSALLQQQAALLQSLGNAGSDAEREQIQEELDGVGAEISDELQALKAKEPQRQAESAAAPAATDGLGAAADMGSSAATMPVGLGQGLKDFAASTYEGMKENAKHVADGEHWVAGQIDAAQDIAASKVQGVADLADGIPVVAEAADLGAAAFDQATQLTAGTWEGAVGLGGGLVQMAANPVDAAAGLYTMAEHVPNPVAGMPNPLKAAHELVNVMTTEQTFDDTSAKLFDPVEQQKDDAEYWKKVGSGIADQYKKTVGEDGDYAKGVGRGLFDLASNFIGVGEAGAAAKAAEAVKAAEVAKAAEAAEVARAAEVANAAEATKAAQATKLGEVGEITKSSALTEATKAVQEAMDEVTKALEASESAKTVVTKSGPPKAGSITAENFARVPGVKKVLERLERLKLPFDLDELIAMLNRDPAAAITELNRRLEIIEAYAKDAMRGGGGRTMEELEELSDVKSPGGRKPKDKTVAGNFYHRWAEIFAELLKSKKARFEDVVPKGSLKPGLEPEFPVPHPDYPPGAKPRIDRLDRAGGEVIEIGPNTQAAQKQAEAMQYAEWMDRFEPLPNGRKWRPRVVLYDQERVLAFLKEIGYIE